MSTIRESVKPTTPQELPQEAPTTTKPTPVTPDNSSSVTPPFNPYSPPLISEGYQSDDCYQSDTPEKYLDINNPTVIYSTRAKCEAAVDDRKKAAMLKDSSVFARDIKAYTKMNINIPSPSAAAPAPAESDEE